MAAKFGVFDDDNNDKLSTLYWLPRLQKIQYIKIFKKRNKTSEYDQKMPIRTTSANSVKFR